MLNPFIYCRKVDDLLTVLCEIRVKSGNRVILRSHRAAGSSPEILRRLERAIASESALGCTRAALADPGEIKSTIRAWGSHQWQNLWGKLPQCRQTKIWLPDVQRSVIGEMPNISRVVLGLVIQFVTGHCYLLKHRSLLEPGLAYECRQCLEEDEDPMHLWWECPAIDSEGRNIGLINKTPVNWLPGKFSRFLRIPPIVEIMGQVEGESSGWATARC